MHEISNNFKTLIIPFQIMMKLRLVLVWATIMTIPYTKTLSIYPNRLNKNGAVSSRPENSLSRQTREAPRHLWYVAPGKRLEIFDSALSTLVEVIYVNPESSLLAGPASEKRAELEEKLKERSTQKNIVFAGNQEDGIKNRATMIYLAGQEANAMLATMKRTLEHMEVYFGDKERLEKDSKCSLVITSYDYDEALGRCIDLLQAEEEQNRIINAAYEETGDAMSIKKVDNKDIISAADIGVALLNTEMAFMSVSGILRKMEHELNDHLEILEMLLNGKVPPRILTGFDLTSTCLAKGKQEAMTFKGCEQFADKIVCSLEVLQTGRGIRVFRLISIPYFHKDATYRVSLPAKSYYKEGSGKIFSIVDCELINDKARCPEIKTSANDCLEKIQTQKGKIPGSCSVERIPNDRPLIQETRYGTLIAQRSATALVAEYENNAISADPFIISNRNKLEITYGSEKMLVDGIPGGNDVITVPKGNITLLAELYNANDWQKKWEELLPLSLRQILLIASIMVQTLIAIPALFALSDSLAKLCGYELLPRNDRGILHRYRARPVEVVQGEELGRLHDAGYHSDSGSPDNDSGYESSASSGRSRLRLQNQRALNNFS